MYLLTPVEEGPRVPQDAEPRPGYLSSCTYLVVFVLLYGLAFGMPFWTDDPVVLDTTDNPVTMSGNRADDPSHNGAHLRPFSEVWRYSWEYVGLAVRCVTLAMLLAGCLVSLCRLCWDRMHHTPPPYFPALCGILAGVTGAYAELALWLGGYLISPNRALTQSQVFCSVTCLFCFFIGIVVYRSQAASNNHLTTLPPNAYIQGPVARDMVEQFGQLNASDVNDHPNTEGSPSTPTRCSVATATEEGLVYATGQTLYDGDSHPSDPSEDDQQCLKRPGEFAKHVCADTCSQDDLPDDLKRLAEGSREDLPDRPKRQFEGCLSKHLSDDLKNLLPAQGDACIGDDFISGGDFDHRTQFIEDDLYYHSSDDDHLEAFIRPDSSPQEQPSPAESRTTVSASSTTRLIQTEKTLLLPFGESDEFYSLSDEEDSYKNKTWP